MLTVEEFKECDAKYILSWIQNEREFKMWSADRYGEYPIKPSEMIQNYRSCSNNQPFYPINFYENFEMIGHMILRYPEEGNRDLIRLGFIIVNNEFRNCGYGRKIIELAMDYAIVNLKAKRFNLGVFTCNLPAFKLYSSVGFKTTKIMKNEFKFYDELWDWAEMEFTL